MKNTLIRVFRSAAMGASVILTACATKPYPNPSAQRPHLKVANHAALTFYLCSSDRLLALNEKRRIVRQPIPTVKQFAPTLPLARKQLIDAMAQQYPSIPFESQCVKVGIRPVSHGYVVPSVPEPPSPPSQPQAQRKSNPRSPSAPLWQPA